MEHVWVCRLGRIPYARAWSWQQQLRDRRRQGGLPDLLLLLEHPPTYTCGRATRPEHLRSAAAPGAPPDIEVFNVERGGSATYHGPGQVVGYPILDLSTRGRDLHRYLRQLEEVLLRALQYFGLQGHTRPGLTGAWVGERKIAAIGVHVRHWITAHGFALNVCPDLAHFQSIQPCGLDSASVVSMAHLMPDPPTLTQVETELARQFGAVFGLGVEEVDPRHLLEDPP